MEFYKIGMIIKTQQILKYIVETFIRMLCNVN